MLDAATAADAVHEYLDEKTAATITAAKEPLVFARERTDLAVNARDYISLVAIEINRAGKRTHHWFGYVWSTIDRRTDPPDATPQDQFVLLADGRPIVLRRDAEAPRELGVAQAPLELPTRNAAALIFGADPEVFDYVARSSDLRMQVIRTDAQSDYLQWRDGRAALGELVRHIGVGPGH